MVNSAYYSNQYIFEEGIYNHDKNNEWIPDPFIGFRLKKLEKRINNKLILKTNELGLRADPLNEKTEYDVLFLGGSFVYGSNASTQLNTIPEMFTNLANIKTVNAGIGGHILKQHLSLYYNYLSFYKFKKIFLIFGFNDAANCFNGNAYNQIKIQKFIELQNSIYDSSNDLLFKIIKSLFNRKKFFKKLPKNNYPKNYPIIIKDYITKLYDEIILFDDVCKVKNIDLKIILQPNLCCSLKRRSDYEENYVRDRFRKNKLTANKINYLKMFHEAIIKSFNNDNKFINFINIYDDVKETIFTDEAHVGDRGNDIFSKKLLDYGI